MGALRILAGLLAFWLLAAAAPVRAMTPVDVCLVKLQSNDGFEGSGGQVGKISCDGPQNRLGAGDFLAELRFAPQQAVPGDPLVLRLTSVWQDGTRLTFRYADGSTAKTAFTSKTAGQFMTIGAVIEVPVPYHQSALTRITMQTDNTANLRGVVLGATIAKQSESYRLRGWLTVLYAGFAGLTIALIIYNFALWAALGHRFQLFYCGMVASLAAYTFTSSGSMLMLFTGFDNNDRLRANYLLLTLAGIMGIQFICSFFGRRVLGDRLIRLAKNLSIVAMICSAAFAVFAPWQIWVLDRAYFLSLAAILCLIVPTVVCAWKARSRYFWLFVLAWAAPVAISFLRALHGLNLLDYHFLLDNGNAIALAIEAMLSALLITARLRDLSHERDNAKEGEQTALRLANSDPLTGLLNRRAFLDKAIGRTEPHRLLLIDIDRFKAINDRLGHDTGDDVLRKVADAIQACRPPESLAVRLGGEEFALLLPLARQDECTPDNILEAVRAKAMPMGRKVTVSLGYVDGHVDTDERWRQLYRLADSALYRAKSDGRDRACRATDFASRSKAAIA